MGEKRHYIHLEYGEGHHEIDSGRELDSSGNTESKIGIIVDDTKLDDWDDLILSMILSMIALQ